MQSLSIHSATREEKQVIEESVEIYIFEDIKDMYILSIFFINSNKELSHTEKIMYLSKVP